MASAKQEASKNDRMAHRPLVDIKNIQIDQSLPVEERIRQYLKSVKNPYYFSCGNIPVEIEFSTEGGPQLQHVIIDYFISKKPHN